MSKSSTTTIDADLLPNPSPGEILLEEFLKPLALSQNALARALHVPPRRINEILKTASSSSRPGSLGDRQAIGAAHVRRPQLDYESHAIGPEVNGHRERPEPDSGGTSFVA